jgi:hypothetical protein
MLSIFPPLSRGEQGVPDVMMTVTVLIEVIFVILIAFLDAPVREIIV